MKISVLTICLNSGAYLERAINSVQNQNYAHIEHVVVDGGSGDDTLAILKKYPSLIWISEKDEGQSDAMNKAFSLATGDIIVYLNADDYFEDNVFNTVIQTFNNSRAEIVIGNFFIKNDETNTLIHPSIEFKKIIFPQKYAFPYNPVSYFYKRKIQETIGKFPLQENYAMDYWFLLRALDKYQALKLDIALGTFLLTDMSKTVLNNKNDTRRLAKEYFGKKPPITKIYFAMHNFYIDITTSIRYWTWLKLPLKYLLYVVKYKRQFRTFKEFKKMKFINLNRG